MSEKRNAEPRVLAVLPESQRTRELLFYLEQQAFDVLYAHEGQSAYDILDAEGVDALIYALREKRIDGARHGSCSMRAATPTSPRRPSERMSRHSTRPSKR